MSAAESATIEAEIAAEAASSPVKKVSEPSDHGDTNEEKPKNGTAKSPTKDEAESLKSALLQLAAGKRHLLVQDPNAAVASLAEACEELGKLYGETAKECGEAYFYYGKALLELARMEAGVIDNVLDGVPDTEDEEESSFVEGPKPTEEEQDKIADDVGKALEENFEELQKVEKAREAKKSAEAGVDMKPDVKTNGDHAEKNGEKKDSEENSTEEEDEEEEEEAPKEGEAEEPVKEEEPEAGPSTEEVKDNESIGSNEAGPSAAKDSTDQKAIEQEEEEDPSNLQLAWEMLELAKTIFTKHADSLDALSPTRLELESKLSETYQTLGEVSIENENYAQAIEDLTMCLRRRQDLLPEDSRCIAETHYQLGVALGFNAQFDEAVSALNDAILVLEKRISLLKESKESRDPSKKDDAFYTRDREIKELEGLIPEIREKIADTKDMQEETFKKLGDRRLMEEAAFASASASNGEKSSETPAPEAATIITSKKAAGNISHLVKKRKKSEEDLAADQAENGDVKKPHLENGASTSNGNGH